MNQEQRSASFFFCFFIPSHLFFLLRAAVDYPTEVARVIVFLALSLWFILARSILLLRWRALISRTARLSSLSLAFITRRVYRYLDSAREFYSRGGRTHTLLLLLLLYCIGFVAEFFCFLLESLLSLETRLLNGFIVGFMAINLFWLYCVSSNLN